MSDRVFEITQDDIDDLEVEREEDRWVCGGAGVPLYWTPDRLDLQISNIKDILCGYLAIKDVMESNEELQAVESLEELLSNNRRPVSIEEAYVRGYMTALEKHKADEAVV